jgi:hypothetical protein
MRIRMGRGVGEVSVLVSFSYDISQVVSYQRTNRVGVQNIADVINEQPLIGGLFYFIFCACIT